MARNQIRFDLINCYAAFRMNLRDLLCVHGVPSNPRWTDEDIIEALADLLKKKNSKTRKRKN